MILTGLVSVINKMLASSCCSAGKSSLDELYWLELVLDNQVKQTKMSKKKVVHLNGPYDNYYILMSIFTQEELEYR